MKYSRKGRYLSCCAVAGILAMAPVAARADMSTNGMSDSPMAGAMVPTQVSGSVLRYYFDRSGYVTAMDIQTANGVSMVRFAPGMGQRLYSMSPIGAQTSVYVVGGPMNNWTVVGTGATVPANYSMPVMIDEVDSLDSDGYLLSGAEMDSWSGNLTDILTNHEGEIVALVLDRNTLVRVPRQLRQISPGANGSDRIANLFKGVLVDVTGYAEAPRYGVLSRYANRVSANALVINGKSVGSLGIPMMSPKTSWALFNGLDIAGVSHTPEEIQASSMGYSVYTAPN